MKALLTFDLSKEEDQSAYKDASEGTQLRLALWEYDQWLRDQIKYHDRGELQDARDKLYEVVDEHDLRMDVV